MPKALFRERISTPPILLNVRNIFVASAAVASDKRCRATDFRLHGARMESREHSIVIVEDEGLIAVDLQGRLERAGYRVPGIAGTAVEALDVIREKSPDLILMDIRL